MPLSKGPPWWTLQHAGDDVRLPFTKVLLQLTLLHEPIASHAVDLALQAVRVPIWGWGVPHTDSCNSLYMVMYLDNLSTSATSSLAVSGAVSAEAGIASASVSAAATKARQRMVLELKQWNPTEGVRGQPQGISRVS